MFSVPQVAHLPELLEHFDICEQAINVIFMHTRHKLAAENENGSANPSSICSIVAVELEVQRVPRAHFIDRVCEARVLVAVYESVRRPS